MGLSHDAGTPLELDADAIELFHASAPARKGMPQPNQKVLNLLDRALIGLLLLIVLVLLGMQAVHAG